MKGFMKIESTEDGISARTEIRECGLFDKVQIMSLVFRSLELRDNEEIAMLCAFAAATNEQNMFNGQEIKLEVPTGAAEDGG